MEGEERGVIYVYRVMFEEELIGSGFESVSLRV